MMRATRKLARRLPAVPELRFRYAAWRIRRRRQNAWDRARVCVVSFPKSGRTWLNVMLARVLGDIRGKGFSLDVPGVLFTHDESDKPALPPSMDGSRYAEKKVVFLSRDPRDILASYYAHRTRRDGTYTGSISEFIRDPGYGLDRVIAFMNAWWLERHHPQAFMLLRYEDLSADPCRELRRVLDFIGAETAPDGVAEAVVFSSFDRMLEMERRGLFGDPRLRAANAEDRESYKVRKGRLGGYRDAFGPTDILFMNQMLAGRLVKEFGYWP